MKISIVTVGTRGDVQPYVALGLGLTRAGHTVKVVTDPAFAGFISDFGLEFAAMDASPLRAVQDASVGMEKNPIRFNRWIQGQVEPVARGAIRQLRDACQGADVMLHSGLAAMFAYPVAQALRLPSISASLWPYAPTREFPSQLAAELPGWVPLRSWYNWLSAYAAPALLYAMIYKTINACRQEVLGIPAIPYRRYASVSLVKSPALYAYSPYVIPRPRDWGEYIHITGYWFLEQDETWQPPAELLSFLAREPKPVYIGFGSMVDEEAEALTRLVVEAVEAAELRAVLLGGWAELGKSGLSGRFLKVDAVPHPWLFPRVSAVVHHGGMGTTAEAFRAGVPMVIVPFYADQPYWGRRAHALGVSPPPIPRQELIAERLAGAMREAVSDAALRQRAVALGEKLRGEDGMGEAVRVIEELMGKPEQLIPEAD